MAIVTVRIDNKSKRGKHLIALISDLAKLGDDIQLEELPATVTGSEFNDPRAKYESKANHVDDLFTRLHA